MSEALFVPTLEDGRRLYARSIFYREGVLAKGPWVIPGGPDSGWYWFLVQTANFLRKGHVDNVTVHYTEAWYKGVSDAHGHEYRLMRPEQAKAANEVTRRP